MVIDTNINAALDHARDEAVRLTRTGNVSTAPIRNLTVAALAGAYAQFFVSFKNLGSGVK